MTWGGFDAIALSFCPYDNVDDFINCHKAYEDFELDDYLKNDLGIYLTLADFGGKYGLNIVEFRLYENSNVIILDNDGEGR